jgi:hypothetical protein
LDGRGKIKWLSEYSVPARIYISSPSVMEGFPVAAQNSPVGIGILQDMEIVFQLRTPRFRKQYVLMDKYDDIIHRFTYGVVIRHRRGRERFLDQYLVRMGLAKTRRCQKIGSKYLFIVDAGYECECQ